MQIGPRGKRHHRLSQLVRIADVDRKASTASGRFRHCAEICADTGASMHMLSRIGKPKPSISVWIPVLARLLAVWVAAAKIVSGRFLTASRCRDSSGAPPHSLTSHQPWLAMPCRDGVMIHLERFTRGSIPRKIPRPYQAMLAKGAASFRRPDDIT